MLGKYSSTNIKSSLTNLGLSLEYFYTNLLTINLKKVLEVSLVIVLVNKFFTSTRFTI